MGWEAGNFGAMLELPITYGEVTLKKEGDCQLGLSVLPCRVQLSYTILAL